MFAKYALNVKKNRQEARGNEKKRDKTHTHRKKIYCKRLEKDENKLNQEKSQTVHYNDSGKGRKILFHLRRGRSTR